MDSKYHACLTPMDPTTSRDALMGGLPEESMESVEVEEFEDGNESGDEDIPSSSDVEGANQKAWQRKWKYLAFIGVVCVASTGIVLSQINASDSSVVSDNLRHGVFDAPQFEQMLWEQIHPVLGSSVHDEELSGHVKHTIKNLKAMAENELPKAQASALKNAQMTAQNWADLKEMSRGGMNPQVQEAGKLMLGVLRENVFSSQEVIARRLKETLQPKASELLELRSKIIPARLDIGLSKWAKAHNESHAAWKGLLDSPLALQPVHEGNAPADRRLSIGVGGVPVGILAVILVAIGEILVHVEMFVPKFNMPSWGWKLILTPVQVVSVLACNNGLNVYCNSIMGAMGLNALDAVFVLFCSKEYFGLGAAKKCQKNQALGMQKDIKKAVIKAVSGS